jgi:hypothetical protein
MNAVLDINKTRLFGILLYLAGCVDGSVAGIYSLFSSANGQFHLPVLLVTDGEYNADKGNTKSDTFKIV